MPQHNYFVAGQWNACCDVCGFVFKSGKLQLRWDGAMTCRKCWEPRHPQDFVRSVIDDPSVPWARPWTADLTADSLDGKALGEVLLGSNTLGGP